VTYYSVHVVWSDAWYRQVLDSPYYFGAPIAAILTFLVTVYGGFYSAFLLAVNCAIAYFVTIAGSPHHISRPIHSLASIENIYYSKGPLVQETCHSIIQNAREHNEIIYQCTRITSGMPYVEIDIEGIASPDKELVWRFSLPDFKNPSQTFYTDANDLWLMGRQYRYFELVQANYYPVTSTVHLRDKNNEHNITILTSQSMGVTCFNGNELEFMIHRRSQMDDERGLKGMFEDDNSRVKISFRVYIDEAMPDLTLFNINGKAELNENIHSRDMNNKFLVFQISPSSETSSIGSSSSSSSISTMGQIHLKDTQTGDIFIVVDNN
jgi:hypothetical protein